MYGNSKSMQDTWSRALALVATISSKLGSGWMGGCAQKARMGLRPFPVYSNCKQGWNRAQWGWAHFVTTWMHFHWGVGSKAFRQYLIAPWLLDSQVVSVCLLLYRCILHESCTGKPCFCLPSTTYLLLELCLERLGINPNSVTYSVSMGR